MSGQYGQLAGPGVPDPSSYDDWKEWVRDFAELVQNNQQQLTQAAVENLLNYQFATWTPTLAGSVTPGTYTLAFGGTARVVRIASQVILSANMVVTVVAPGVGDAQIGGLPLPMFGGTLAYGAVSFDGPFAGQLVAKAGADVITIEQVASGVPPVPLDVTTISTGDTISFTIAYLTNP